MAICVLARTGQLGRRRLMDGEVRAQSLTRSRTTTALGQRGASGGAHTALVYGSSPANSVPLLPRHTWHGREDAPQLTDAVAAPAATLHEACGRAVRPGGCAEDGTRSLSQSES